LAINGASERQISVEDRPDNRLVTKDPFWWSTDTQLVEIMVKQLTVGLLMRMSGVGQTNWTSVNPLTLRLFANCCSIESQ